MRAVVAQDGHSLGEQAVYEALWRLGGGRPGDPSCCVSIGYDRLAREIRLNEKSARDNIRSLIAKLAVEVIGAENSATRQGKTYKVYSYAAILERRTRAGMEWVERNKGVRFVDRPTVGVSTTVGESTSVGVTTSVGVAISVGETATVVDSPSATVGETTTETVGETTTPLEQFLEHPEEQPSSSFAVIAATCHNVGLTFDDDAARRLLQTCRERDADATPEEVAHFVSVKLEQFRGKRDIQNLPGLLIHSVPKYFPSTELRQLRGVWRWNREGNR